MAAVPIHPGEHLAEEIKTTRHERGRTGAQNFALPVPTNGSRRYSMDSALLPATHLFASPISSAPAPNSGSICRVSTNCASHNRRPARPLKGYPRYRSRR